MGDGDGGDDFGDVYTDVLRPFSAQFRPQREESAAAGKASALSQGRPINLNINRDDGEILYGAPDTNNQNPNPNLNSNSALCWNSNAPVQQKHPRGFDLNLGSISEAARIDGLAGNGCDGLGLEAKIFEKGEVKTPLRVSAGSNFMDDDDDIDIVLENNRENKAAVLLKKEEIFRNKEEGDMYITAAQKENTINFINKSVDCETGTIPGLSGKLENPMGSNFGDEWESEESEDDLQIVLNDNNHEPRMTGVTDEDDEDGEPLVIVADNGDVGPQLIMEESVWGGGVGGLEADGDKDLGHAAKTSGGVGVGSVALQPKIAYNNHLYHHPFHSQFKYVRPGASPLPAAAPGQVRPPVSVGPTAGRGRGDWRPAGIKGPSAIQKGFHPGYGMPAWVPNTACRGYGSGLDFTLPSHKTIFEVDIDSFEDKPWKLPDVDVSDFFNFAMNEDSWIDYCKQLEQLRLQTTMQSKIRVYESGRAEQDFYPELPPELAAVVGIQDIPFENSNPGKVDDAGSADLARGNAQERASLPVGRPIPVETCFGDRLPSIDTRRPRFHDTNAIIEIVCESSMDGNDLTEQQENDSPRKDLGRGETDDDNKGDTNSFSPAHNGQKSEAESRGAHLKNTVGCDREDVLEFSAGVSSYHPDRAVGLPHEERSTKGRGHNMKTASDNNKRGHIIDDQDEESIHSGDDKSSPPTLSSEEEQDLADENEMNDVSVMDDRREEAVGVTTRYTREDGNIIKYSMKKQKSTSVQEEDDEDDDDDDDDSKAGRSSDNRKSRSGSSKDNHLRRPDDVEDEVHQDGLPPAVMKKQVGDDDYIYARRKGRYERDETGRHKLVAKGRGDPFLGTRIKVEDPRKRDHGGEFVGSRNRGKFRGSERSERDEHYQSRNQLDNGSWRVATSRDHDFVGSRQRDRDNSLRSRNEKIDVHNKRRKEAAHKSRKYAEKEDISHNNRDRRKRYREDGSAQLKRDEQTRLQDDDLHYARQKEGGSFERERQRECNEWYITKQDEVPSMKEREDKTWISHSREKDIYNEGSDREYNPKDVAQHGDQFKRRGWVENGCFSQHGRGHEDTYAPGTQLNNDDKKTRYERPNSQDRHVAYGSGASRVMEHKQKEGSRKNKESEGRDRSSLIPSQRNHGGHINETVNLRGRTEQQNGEDSSDDKQPDLKKGRSKLERWTSHKERDFNIISMSSPSRDLETHNKRNGASFFSKQPPEELSKKVEDKARLPLDEKEYIGVSPDKRLDTVEKLKKRSERFKLPMPSDKDAMAVNKMESEPLPLAQTVIRPDSVTKSERPTRKRRWTGN